MRLAAFLFFLFACQENPVKTKVVYFPIPNDQPSTKVEVPDGADASSFSQIGDAAHGVFFQDKNAIYCDASGGEKSKWIRLEVDTSSLRRMFPGDIVWAEALFYTDGRKVFTRRCSVLEEADPGSFKKIVSPLPDGLHTTEPYFGDDQGHMYYVDQKIPEVNAKAFTVLREGFARDDKKVFFEGREIPSADPETFTTLCRKELPDGLQLQRQEDTCGGKVGMDKNRVFDPAKL